LVSLRIEAKPVLSLTAGTAVSERTRGEENGFNWIDFDPSTREGEVRALSFGAGEFAVREKEKFIWA
jgi:hypothetical protein